MESPADALARVGTGADRNQRPETADVLNYSIAHWLFGLLSHSEMGEVLPSMVANPAFRIFQDLGTMMDVQ